MQNEKKLSRRYVRQLLPLCVQRDITFIEILTSFSPTFKPGETERSPDFEAPPPRLFPPTVAPLGMEQSVVMDHTPLMIQQLTPYTCSAYRTYI